MIQQRRDRAERVRKVGSGRSLTSPRIEPQFFEAICHLVYAAHMDDERIIEERIRGLYAFWINQNLLNIVCFKKSYQRSPITARRLRERCSRSGAIRGASTSLFGRRSCPHALARSSNHGRSTPSIGKSHVTRTRVPSIQISAPRLASWHSPDLVMELSRPAAKASPVNDARSSVRQLLLTG